MTTIDEIITLYRRGWMTHDQAVSALLETDPVRFQRQEHCASSFLALNA